MTEESTKFKDTMPIEAFDDFSISENEEIIRFASDKGRFVHYAAIMYGGPKLTICHISTLVVFFSTTFVPVLVGILPNWGAMVGYLGLMCILWHFHSNLIQMTWIKLLGYEIRPGGKYAYRVADLPSELLATNGLDSNSSE